MQIFRGVSLLALCAAVVMAQPTNENERALHEVSQGAEQFSSAFFHAVAQANPGNLITSPLSASLVLAMAAYGARGNTQVQMKNALHLPNEEAVGRAGYRSLIDTLNDVKDVELKAANKIYVGDKFSVKPTFMELTQSAFRSASQSVNFGNPTEAANIINTWCQENTNNRIKDIVQASDLDPMTAMVLVNAVYFKGNWKVQFKPEHTTDRDFHVDQNTVKKVPTMYKKDNLRYGVIPEIKARFVEIPYKGDQLSMVIIVPDEIGGLAEMEDKLKTMPMSDILQRGFKVDVKVFLPKFKIESTIELNPILRKLGMTDMFEDKANFSGISDQPLAVSKAVQKAFIEVNEEGSEAAAVTGINARPLSSLWKPPEPVVFTVDRPFTAIVKCLDDLILFRATVVS